MLGVTTDRAEAAGFTTRRSRPHLKAVGRKEGARSEGVLSAFMSSDQPNLFPRRATTITVEPDGQSSTALNGGPVFTFNEATSLQGNCPTQPEIDYCWDRLREGGDEAAQQCGWLRDKFGLSWQVVPTALSAMLSDPGSERTRRGTEAMVRMKKLDIEEVKRICAT